MSVVNISAWCQWCIFKPDVSGDYFSLMSVVNILAWCQWWIFQSDVSGQYFSLMSVVNISDYKTLSCQVWTENIWILVWKSKTNQPIQLTNRQRLNTTAWNEISSVTLSEQFQFQMCPVPWNQTVKLSQLLSNWIFFYCPSWTSGVQYFGWDSLFYTLLT